MKTKLLAALAIFMTLSFSATGEENDREEILRAMEFPSPSIKFGTILNDPFFTVNIGDQKSDHAETEKKIKVLESPGKTRITPDKLYQLGNLYSDLMDYKKAVKYYKEYLKSTDESEYNNMKDKNLFQLKGEVCYSLSRIDHPSERIKNLERSLIYLTKAFDLDPAYHPLWIKIGDCYLSLGKSSEAVYCYNKYMEKNRNDSAIYPRLQAAVFQRDYNKLIEADEIDISAAGEGMDFSYIETAVNNADTDEKDLVKLQHHIYLVRLLLLKKEYHLNEVTSKRDGKNSNRNDIFLNNEKRILYDTEKLIQTTTGNNTDKNKLKYLSGIINYLKEDYIKSVSEFNEIPKINSSINQVHDEVIFINLFLLNEKKKAADLIEDNIKINPRPEYYLSLAYMEFNNNNIDKALMLCNQSLKIDEKFSGAYSGLSVLYASKGNYLAADEMIKKGNSLINRDDNQRSSLFNQMRVNEAAIALLKNEKERAYILLRSVISADNNRKALNLYNRYFTKK
ncbi:MAG: hypothetical protein CVV49_09785 [Spirochaetae bacterium HGW-Spirochaetae-5]|nr:MAG: hypothetical protein CVV49_09785 [Spirochaetae bacterium HGW-Spirochaetae-5]